MTQTLVLKYNTRETSFIQVKVQNFTRVLDGPFFFMVGRDFLRKTA